MDTLKLESEKYYIYGKDEDGLIPEGVIVAKVDYITVNKHRHAVLVKFYSKRTDVEEEQRINPKRTQIEILKIANRLERALKTE